MYISRIISIIFLSLIICGCNQIDPIQDARTLSIDYSKQFQTIDGFGACFVNYKEFPNEYSDPEFFDLVVNDLGLSLLRIPITEHTEFKNDNDDPNVFNWDGFYLKNNSRRKGLEETMKIVQEFKKRGVQRFMATPWSPPQYMKTNQAQFKGAICDMI
jgi:O-glycosyl hydrolase